MKIQFSLSFLVFQIVAQNLQVCKIGPDLKEDAAKCISDREEASRIRHHVRLLKHDFKHSLTLNCHVCEGENPNDFSWYYQERTETPIFQMKEEDGADPVVSLIPPGGVLLERSRFIGQNTEGGNVIPCLLINSSHLYIASFHSELHIGTYYCSHFNNSRHPSNFIWYHVDVILPMISQKTSEQVMELTQELLKMQHIDKATQIPGIMDKLGSSLMSSSAFLNGPDNIIAITSILSSIEEPSQSCGSFEMTRYRRCYVKIPQKITLAEEKAMTANMKINYNFLLSAFDFLFKWQNEADPAIIASKEEAAINRAVDLGFNLIPNTSEVYIPCQYTYFKHFELSIGLPKPFSMKNLFAVVNFELPCPEVDPLSIVNMALAGDIKSMKTDVLGFEQIRYMKNEMVTIEATRDFDLICGGEADNTDFNCSKIEDIQILWKQKGGMTFTLQTFIDERIFLTEACRLRFSTVKLSDEGTYSCFKRDTRLKHQWQRNAFISFRLKVESVRYKMPVTTDILLGLIIMTCWAGILILLWIILAFWNFKVSRTAMIQAKERRRKKDRFRKPSYVKSE